MNILISDLRKSYGEKEVLSGLYFEFPEGITSVMGPNGSGKSTLLRLCAMLEPPSGGDLVFMEDGTPLVHDIKLRRRVTLVLPRAGIFNTTVYRNASYGLRVRGIGRLRTRKRVHEVLEKVGLINRRGQNALSLSSGESQRLALARAMVIEPDVLLLDEPTASVDEENTAIIEDIIRGMRRHGGPTIIMATHDREQARRLGSRILHIRKGMKVSAPQGPAL